MNTTNNVRTVVMILAGITVLTGVILQVMFLGLPWLDHDASDDIQLTPYEVLSGDRTLTLDMNDPCSGSNKCQPDSINTMKSLALGHRADDNHVVAENYGKPFTTNLGAEREIGAARTIDYLLALYPLVGFGLIIWATLLATRSMSIRRMVGRAAAVYIVLIIAPFVWRFLSESNWRSSLEDRGASDTEIDSFINGLSDLYAFYPFLLVLLIPMAVTAAAYWYLGTLGEHGDAWTDTGDTNGPNHQPDMALSTSN